MHMMIKGFVVTGCSILSPPSEDFDPAQLEADYLFEVEDKARVKAEKEAIKAKEKEAKIALKNARAKDKA